jgi:hypothetical protein
VLRPRSLIQGAAQHVSVAPTLQHEAPHPQLVLPQRMATHVHVEFLQRPSGHTFPQLPQLLALVAVFTQVPPPQSVRPAAQAQPPFEQISPDPQVTQLGPQCVASLFVSKAQGVVPLHAL